MIEYHQYECEVCRGIVDNLQECLNCESGHQYVDTDQLITHKFSNFNKYPDYIEVTMTDGKKMKFFNSYQNLQESANGKIY